VALGVNWRGGTWVQILNLGKKIVLQSSASKPKDSVTQENFWNYFNLV
jgi:hypothetical protein